MINIEIRENIKKSLLFNFNVEFSLILENSCASSLLK